MLFIWKIGKVVCRALRNRKTANDGCGIQVFKMMITYISIFEFEEVVSFRDTRIHRIPRCAAKQNKIISAIGGGKKQCKKIKLFF